MSQLSEIRQRFQKILGESISQFSSVFMGLSSDLKSNGTSEEALKKIDKLFKMLIGSNRALSGEINSLMDQYEKNEEQYLLLNEERQRLETLYTSGILFSSETELKALMEKAIEVVVRELHADAGFIVLVNERGEPDSIYSRNMNPEEHPSAKEMSTTVIRNTILQSKPIQTDDVSADMKLSKQQSIIKLGITAVVCVPLVALSKLLGAVYLARRDTETPFTEIDL